MTTGRINQVTIFGQGRPGVLGTQPSADGDPFGRRCLPGRGHAALERRALPSPTGAPGTPAGPDHPIAPSKFPRARSSLEGLAHLNDLGSTRESAPMVEDASGGHVSRRMRPPASLRCVGLSAVAIGQPPTEPTGARSPAYWRAGLRSPGTEVLESGTHLSAYRVLPCYGDEPPP
jgi:hypothetical protein